MRTLAAAFVLASTLGSTASGQSPQMRAPAAQPTGAISGVVKDGVTGATIEGALVSLRAPSTGAPLARITRQVTDERGRFVFRDLAAGNGYTLEAMRPGYVTGSYGQSVMFGPTGRISLDDAEWFSTADISLFRPAAISGRVIDERNEPVVGVYVRALSRVLIAGNPQLLAGPIAKTDDRGEYRLAGLAPGAYVVYVPSPSATVPPDTPDNALGAPAPPPEFSLLLSAPTQPRTDALLDSVEGHRAVIGNFATPPPPGSDGRPRIYPMAFHPGASSLDAAQTVTLALGDDRTGVDIPLQPVAAVNVFGRVSGPPESLKALMLRLVPVGLEGIAHGVEAGTTMAASDGQFAFLRVPPGEYVIDAPGVRFEFTAESGGQPLALPNVPGIPPGGSGSQSGAVLAGPPGTGYVRRQFSSRSDAFWTRTSLTIGQSDVRNVVVTIEPSLTMRGRLEYVGTTQTTIEQTRTSVGVGGVSTNTAPTVTTTAPPRPSTQPAIVAEPASGDATLGMPRSTRPGENDPQDRFTIPGLKHGEYVLRSSSGTGRYMVQSILVDGVDHSRRPIDAAKLSTSTEVVITFTDRLITLSGSVTSDTGTAESGMVMVFPAERAEWKGYGLTPMRLKSAPLAGSSKFAIEGLPAGEYFVVALQSAQATAWQDPAFLEKAAAVATRVALAWGETREMSLRQVTVR